MPVQDDALLFEVLAMDEKNECKSKSEANLLHALMAYTGLWQSPSLEPNRISDGELELTLESLPMNTEGDSSVVNAFVIHVRGSFARLEPLRVILIEYLHTSLRLERLYVLRDEVSEHIANKIYPLLYRVENSLRGYLARFMSTRLGPLWWKKTATADISQKAQQRRNNETVFAPFVDSNAYLIDFGDLGKMVYAHSSGFTSRDDIVNRLGECEETPEAIRRLKAEVQSNYTKFFKDSFKDKAFQTKWEEMEKIRHKIAHNSLFSATDLQNGERLAAELTEIISEAVAAVEQCIISEEEKGAIQSNLVSSGIEFDCITDAEFLSELAKEEEFYRRRNGFVGLNHFIKSHLGFRGYNIDSSYEMAWRLHDQGKVRIFDRDHSTDSDSFRVKQIKTSLAAQISDDDE